MANTAKTGLAKNQPFEIRKAELQDVEDIYAAQLATFPDDPTNLSKDEITQVVLGNADSLILIAHDGEQFCGYVLSTAKKYRPWFSLDNLIVSRKYAGLGIGKSLMQAMLKQCKNRPFMRLFVERKNTPAINLYKKLGFFRGQTKTAHYENNDDAFIMYKLLFKA